MQHLTSQVELQCCSLDHLLEERGCFTACQLQDAEDEDVARAIHSLARQRPITSSDVRKVILVYRLRDDNVDDRQTVVLDEPLNGAYFTARDIVCGVGSFVERWQWLVVRITNFFL